MLANLRAPLIATVACLSAWGCSHEQGPTVRVPPDFPADPAAVHPWIRSFAGKDVVQAQKMLQARLEEPNSPELTQLATCLADFTPERIDRHGNSYYLVCVRQTSNLTTLAGLGDQLYIAQPLPEAVIAGRIEYFDESIRPQIRSFYWRYAGSGEEMEGEAGQFSLHHEATAGQHLAACLDVLDPAWEDARLFYFARSGDTLYLNRQGATAWHDAEADEFVPLFDTFPEFVRHYAQFRGTSEVFDSWTSYQFLQSQPSPTSVSHTPPHSPAPARSPRLADYARSP
jgi:hypothetical protein